MHPNNNKSKEKKGTQRLTQNGNLFHPQPFDDNNGTQNIIKIRPKECTHTDAVTTALQLHANHRESLVSKMYPKVIFKQNQTSHLRHTLYKTNS